MKTYFGKLVRSWEWLGSVRAASHCQPWAFGKPNNGGNVWPVTRAPRTAGLTAGRILTLALGCSNPTGTGMAKYLAGADMYTLIHVYIYTYAYVYIRKNIYITSTDPGCPNRILWGHDGGIRLLRMWKPG